MARDLPLEGVPRATPVPTSPDRPTAMTLPRPFALALPLVLLATPAPAAPAPTGGDEVAAQETDERATTRRRLLHLTSGVVLRAKSRHADGRWEVRGAGGWTALPAGAVDHARSEREVLSDQAARRTRTASPPPPTSASASPPGRSSKASTPRASATSTGCSRRIPTTRARSRRCPTG